MNILKEMGAALKGVIKSKVPAVIQSGYHIGERVEYTDHSILPIHRGTVVRTWNNRVKIVFDGFEHGTWLEEEAIGRYVQ